MLFFRRTIRTLSSLIPSYFLGLFNITVVRFYRTMEVEDFTPLDCDTTVFSFDPCSRGGDHLSLVEVRCRPQPGRTWGIPLRKLSTVGGNNRPNYESTLRQHQYRPRILDQNDPGFGICSNTPENFFVIWKYSFLINTFIYKETFQGYVHPWVNKVSLILAYNSIPLWKYDDINYFATVGPVRPGRDPLGSGGV